MTDLRALLLVCTLKPSPSESSSELLARDLEKELQQHGVLTEVVRVVDHDVRFGVSTDEGDGDEWPELRSKMLQSNILALVTPIWMGQPSSVCKMVMERLDAELSETDDEGRMTTYGKVGMVGVVGNEDGAHHVIAQCLQALNDVGFSFAANAGSYWVGEAMQAVDYKDHDETPEKTAATNKTAARTAVHLARLLQENQYAAK
jgi:multimeric flavodoxin WrbA